jgi:cytoskeletal protein RodZ
MSQPPEAKTPGELLRAARLKRGLDLEALATETKIASALLNALEQDEYHKVSGPIYVRSFLRTYAEALNLDAHQLVALYEQQAGSGDAVANEEFWEEERVAVRVVGIPYGSILLRYVLPVVLVVVVVVVGLWLRGRSTGPEPNASSNPPSLLQPDSTGVGRFGAEAGTDSAFADSAGVANEDTVPATSSSGAGGRPAIVPAMGRDRI